MNEPLIELRAVSKVFKSADGHVRTVLADVDFALREGEVVALMGRSGCGKSTLLRILAGLVPADQGTVLYRGKPLYGPARAISMVFQSFALFPWLTVQQNVELGLEARGMPPAQRAERARDVLDLIGLSGFEGALPRELSGGMKQRVGIARALVTEPEVLLMDEAFSALDVLTGERLRDDVLELWSTGKLPTKAMLVVSHNIEEAVVMADRVLVMGSDPGRVRAQLSVQLPRPRSAESGDVRHLVDEAYALMTAASRRVVRTVDAPVAVPLTERLPHADVAQMNAVLEVLSDPPFHGRADLPQLAEETELSDHALLPVAHGLSLLGLAYLESGDLQLSARGRRYVEADHAQRQQIFGEQLLAHVPLAAHIRDSLEREPDGALPVAPFRKLLEERHDAAEAQRVLDTLISWARQGEVFEYDFNTGVVSLPRAEEPEQEADTGTG